MEDVLQPEWISLKRNVVVMEYGLELPIVSRMDIRGNYTPNNEDVVVLVTGNDEMGYYTIALGGNDDITDPPLQ